MIVDIYRSTPRVELQQLLDEACGSFSFISNGTRLTYDCRKIYNNLILSRDWVPMVVMGPPLTDEQNKVRYARPMWIVE